MTEQELLEKTKNFMSQAGLVEGFGLGRTWVIVRSITHFQNEIARERYEELKQNLSARFPDDVHEIVQDKTPPKFGRHLCVRCASNALQAFLAGEP